MKEQKKSNTAKAVKNLFENLGENETLFVLHDDDVYEIGIGYTKKKTVTSTIAAIIATSLQNRGENESFDNLTDIILDAVKLVRQTPVVGLELIHRELMDAIEEWKGTHEEEGKEEEHPCEGCADILTCMDDDAIDYRKKHHLPKPKKGKKSK
jgi:hypothetical protein